MNTDKLDDIRKKINSCKFQIIINKNLYLDNVINKEYYELVENSLLKKLNILSNALGIDF